ncbi:hydroxyacylglutathione hydrolase [Paenalcaligenes hominis]|uniref:hydroxyacylglutathione hydrolase n=1 Tax=Paenalcaligenes hominis TaxID=643674 RepID=UPI0035248327
MTYQFSQPSDLQLKAIPAFNDNYIWLLHNQQYAVAVDPGDAQPVLSYLKQHSLQLTALLITHHHHDHVGGITELVQAYPDLPVYGPANETIPQRTQAVHDQDPIYLSELGVELRVLTVPGHTKGHVAYFGYSDTNEPFLFCGDTLFSGGCGRLFEGTAAQMLGSLNKITALPPQTLVCCAHEYTLANLNWALEVEPDNSALHAYYTQAATQRANHQPTLPSSIGLELRINPFLRTHIPAVQLSASQYGSRRASTDTEVFAQLREWKNNA